MMKALLEALDGSIATLEVDSALPEIRLPGRRLSTLGPWNAALLPLGAPTFHQRRFLVLDRMDTLLYQEALDVA